MAADAPNAGEYPKLTRPDMMAAQKAQATAENAQQMVRNRDPKIKSLEDVAAEFVVVTTAADTEHQRLQAAIDANRTSAASANAKAATAQAGADTATATANATKVIAGTAQSSAAAAQASASTAQTSADAAKASATAAQATADAALAAANKPRYFALGTGRIAAALLLGNSTDVTVTLSRTMPNTTYTVELAPTAGMTMVVKSKTTTTVVVTVTAVLALTLGQTFTLMAWA